MSQQELNCRRFINLIMRLGINGIYVKKMKIATHDSATGEREASVM